MTTPTDSSANFRDGPHLRAARMCAGLTRVRLAAAAMVHPNSVKYWEASRRTPRGRTVCRIAAALAAFGVDTRIETDGRNTVAVIRRR
jgi:transcriptional regulator with XRE-family HTH domain